MQSWFLSIKFTKLQLLYYYCQQYYFLYNFIMESTLIKNKVKLLFKKISEPNYVMNSYYADHFFIKINSGDHDVDCLKSWPDVADLLIEALNNVDNTHKTVKVFITRLLGVVAQEEVHFAKIFAKKGTEIAKAFSELNSQSMDSSLRVAFMEIALSLTHHNFGIYWLLETGIWKEILSLCNEKRTVFVVRQTYKFASLFVWKLVDLNDEASIKLVLAFIIKPMAEIDVMKLDFITSEREEELSKILVPVIQILQSIISNDRIKSRNCLIELMFKDFKITTLCYIMWERFRRDDVILLITKVIFWFSISKIFVNKPIELNLQYDRDDFMEVIITYFNTITYLIQRRSPTLVFDYCNACNLIWGSVWGNMKPAVWELDGRKVELQKQLLVICLIPSIVYLTAGKYAQPTEPDVVDTFIIKLMNSTCEHTARTAYALRDLMLGLDMQSVTLQSMKRLTCLKDHLNNDQANLLFQALFYVLREYDPIDDHGAVKVEKNYTDSEEQVLVMTYVLDILLSLVKKYNINWQDSFEVLNLYTVVFNILKKPNLSCRFIVLSLNVITITVKKFLPPTLSLLMESKPGTSMGELGKLIYMKMNDFQWEIRDSALELLYVCTDICYIKFPPFQKQILENNLINLATTMALNDHEFYVRVSALKCLAAASKVGSLWEHLKLQYPNIQENLLETMQNNHEGVVRKEVCNVLCEIYQSVKLTTSFKSILFENMVCAALSDFHWEVQLSALKFWKIVIQSLLTSQGMLDGTFPPVTFSKETRKIVNLDDNEIKRRLTRILEELSSIGCLTVLVKLLNDETDVEIMDSARIVSNELLEILDKYNVPDNLQPNENEPSVDDLQQQTNVNLNDISELGNISEPETSVAADNVIESILNSDDINLLANIYERQMNLSPEQDVTSVKVNSKILKFASPYLFVTFMRSKDFKQIIEEKRNWKDGIKSLSSLLDDVLGIYEVNEEVNTLDCY